MAKKQTLTDAQIKALAGYGITSTDYDTAKKQLINQLEAHDLEDLADEDIDSLLTFREAFPAEEEEEKVAPAKAKKKEVVEEEDDEEEAPAPKKKAAPAKKKTTLEEEEEENDEMLAGDDEADDADVPEADEEEEEAPAPKKKAATAKPAPAAKKADAKKTTAKKEDKPKKANGAGFDKNNEDHMALVKKVFGKVFPAKEFAIAPIVGGITVRFLGQNAKVVIFKYNNLRIEDGKTLIGDLNFKKIKDIEVLKNLLPEELVDAKKIEKVQGRGYTRINDLTAAEIVSLLSNGEVMEEVLKTAKKLDTKMGASRKEMEKAINGSKATKSKKPVVDEADDIAEDVEETGEEAVAEEEIEAATPKKASKKKAAIVEEEDDEEEAPAPKKAAKGKKK